MKRLLKILSIILLIIFTYPFIKKFTESKEYKMNVHLYQSEEYSNPIYRYLRVIPKSHIGKYEIIKVTDSLNYQIYRVDDYGATGHMYLTYRKNKIVDLMSHNLVIDAIKKGFVNKNEINRYYDLVVNKKEFNKIYRHLDKKSKQIIYSNLFRTSLDSSTYHLVENKSDVNSILKLRPKSEGTVIEYLIDSTRQISLHDESIKDFTFLDSSNENVIYYWYYDKGLMKFEFKYNSSGDISSVNYLDLGYLGNEITHL